MEPDGEGNEAIMTRMRLYMEKAFEAVGIGVLFLCTVPIMMVVLASAVLTWLASAPLALAVAIAIHILNLKPKKEDNDPALEN